MTGDVLTVKRYVPVVFWFVSELVENARRGSPSYCSVFGSGELSGAVLEQNTSLLCQEQIGQKVLTCLKGITKCLWRERWEEGVVCATASQQGVMEVIWFSQAACLESPLVSCASATSALFPGSHFKGVWLCNPFLYLLRHRPVLSLCSCPRRPFPSPCWCWAGGIALPLAPAAALDAADSTASATPGFVTAKHATSHDTLQLLYFFKLV